MDETLSKAFKNFIVETVQNYLADQKDLALFDDLPSVCLVSELADKLKSSDEVIVRMAKDGMPHVHVGREYRFMKSLLQEWARSGQRNFPCEVCSKKPEKKNENLADEQNTGNVRSLNRQISHQSANKLASMVGGN